MYFRFRIAALAVVLIGCVVSVASAQGDVEAGFVLSMKGAWFASSQPRDSLMIGQVLREGDSVWAARPNEPDQFLSIALYGDRERLVLSCERQDVCTRRHQVHRAGSTMTRVRDLLVAIGGIIRGSPELRFVAPQVRGGRETLAEGVFLASPDGIDLTPVLPQTLLGRPQLVFAPLDSAATPGAWHALGIRIQPGTPPRMVADLDPGLYAIHQEGDTDGEAWILVVPPGVSSAVDTFRVLESYVTEWGDSGIDDGRIVLRTYLYGVAQGRKPELTR